MPRAKVKPEPTLAELREAHGALIAKLAILERSIEEYERRAAFEPGDTIHFDLRGVVNAGKVGARRELPSGLVEYYVYVDNPDGFGTTPYKVLETRVRDA